MFWLYDAVGSSGTRELPEWVVELNVRSQCQVQRKQLGRGRRQRLC